MFCLINLIALHITLYLSQSGQYIDLFHANVLVLHHPKTSQKTRNVDVKWVTTTKKTHDKRICGTLRDLVPFVQFTKRENTHGGVRTNTPPWLFFTFFKLYKWYQIAQRVTYRQLGLSEGYIIALWAVALCNNYHIMKHLSHFVIRVRALTSFYFNAKVWCAWPEPTTFYNQKSHLLLVGSRTATTYSLSNTKFSLNYFNMT